MNNLKKDYKTNRVDNRAKNSKRKIIAVSFLFIVACSFSYCAGMQQNGDTSIPLTKTITGNSENTNQNTTQTNLADSLAQQEPPANNQYEEGAGDLTRRLGRHGRHGYYRGNSAYNDGPAVGQYDAAPQRCCATGKTGTCHS
jgi:hypothetical protein